MALLECCRLLLYLIQWIWTTVILAIFPNQLIDTVQLGNGTSTSACLFNLKLGLSRCNFALAWAAIAFTVLTVTILWYTLEYCTTIQLPNNVETVIFSWLTIWWLVGSIVFTATRASGAPSPSTVPVVFAWMLTVLSAVSAFVANRGPKTVEYRMSDTEPSRSYE